MEEEIEFIKRINRVVKKSKIERSPYLENSYKRILIELIEPDWDIFQKILNKLQNTEKLINEAYKEGYKKGIQPQILENWHNEHARIIKVKSQFVPISLIKNKIEDYKERKRYYEDENLVYDDEYYSYEIIIQVLQELLDERNNADV